MVRGYGSLGVRRGPRVAVLGHHDIEPPTGDPPLLGLVVEAFPPKLLLGEQQGEPLGKDIRRPDIEHRRTLGGASRAVSRVPPGRAGSGLEDEVDPLEEEGLHPPSGVRVRVRVRKKKGSILGSSFRRSSASMQ